MVKLVAIALLAIAFVGNVSAEDDASEETSLLMGNANLFSTYCLTQRQAIKEDIKVKANQASSQVFRMFFNQFVVEVADEVMDVTREEVKRYAEHIKTPSSLESAPVETISENEIEDRLQKSIEILKNQPQAGLFSRLRNAATSVADAARTTVTSALYLRLAKLRTIMSMETFLQSLVNACEQVKLYEDQLKEKLDAVKTELVAEHDQREVQKFIKSVSVRNLQCQTTRVITRLQGFCTVVIGGSQFFLKAIGSFTKVDFPSPTLASAQSEN